MSRADLVLAAKAFALLTWGVLVGMAGIIAANRWTP